MNQLESIFDELGLSQYLDAVVDQGFDSWDTILDITESDLDALGVKLGHRRKLQRRIANYRGVAPVISLVSPTRISIEDVPGTSQKTTLPAETKDVSTVAKRKYRRHPKPDENAPERPPSAYVLFSNKMREDLKGQNLSFTEIAKLVGENWQNLDRSEKEPYETQAQEAKEKYNRDMSEYKKTEDYKKYSDYLQEFRKRQAAQERDSSKRIKMDSEHMRGSSTSGVSHGRGATTSATGSSSDSQPGSEPPPTQQQRINSVTSHQDAHVSPGGPLHAYHHSSEESSRSPRHRSYDEDACGIPRGLSGSQSFGNSPRRSRRHSSLHESQRNISDSPNRGVPWLASSSEPTPTISQSPEHGLPSIAPSLNSSSATSRSGSGSSRFWSGPPSLKTDISSAGSSSSLSSSYPAPRTPSESSLPIHALLSSKPEASYGSQLTSTPVHESSVLPQPPVSYPHAAPSSNYASNSSGNLPLAMPLEPAISILNDQQKTPTLSRPSKGSAGSGLDGMSALLQASDIVDRQSHY